MELPLNRTASGYLSVLAALVVGAWFRASLALSSGLWRDEAQSLAISRLPTLGDMLSFLAAQDSHPPLFYLVERLWSRLLGTSDPAVIALGLLPGALLIPATAGVAWQYAGRRAGLLAAWYTALAWPLVWQSGDARPYPFLSLATLLTVVAARVAPGSRSGAWWAAYAVGCLTLLYTHNWWVLVVAALALVTLASVWKRPGKGWGRLRPWLVTHAIMALLYLPWVPILLRQSRSAGYAGQAHFPIEWVVIAPTLQLGVSLSLLLPTVALLVLGAWRAGTSPRTAAFVGHLVLVAALPCLLALAAWESTDLTSTYCAVALSPLVLVAVACSLGGDARPESSLRKGVAGFLFLAVLSVMLTDRWYLKSNVREMARLVSVHAKPGDLVLVFPSSIGPVFERYDSSGAEVVVYPPQTPSRPTQFAGWWRRFDDPEGISRILQVVADAGREGRDVWLVNQLRVDHSPDSTAPVGTRDRFRHSVGARIVEIRNGLRSGFGPPDPVRSFLPAEWRRELVRVEHYSGDSAAELSRVPVH